MLFCSEVFASVAIDGNARPVEWVDVWERRLPWQTKTHKNTGWRAG
jgi:hypothetical protein